MKKTTEEFNYQSTYVHGDKYDYSLVDYKDSKTKVDIICKTHNEIFKQTPSSHLSGRGCPKCAIELKAKNLRYTLEIFIEKANIKHDNLYTYPNFVYVDNKVKGLITCEKHGDFEMIPNAHLNGQGCPHCARERTTEAGKKTKEQFIQECSEVHNNFYSYDNFNFVNYSTKGNITCPIHGDFEQTPTMHTQGQGCASCWKERSGYTRTDFIKRADKKDGKAILYILKINSNNEEFYKIGITTQKVSRRFRKGVMPYEYEIIHELKSDAGFIYDSEKKLIREFKDYRYEPEIHFHGHTECFNKNIEILIKSNIK